MSALFLTRDELIELTGVKTGQGGKPREVLQSQWLRSVGIPYWVNARGAPIVARVAIEGSKHGAAIAAAPAWSPRVISGGAQ
ncbi:DUF4224 domain-containing protein [Chitinibacter sp. GC72]|uniref:DUF4224 domain-containing protein n=1 Tax=Chitinibacter sp. GC72 TaxID=1526917 RepID=UPI0012FBCB64|nr:DUF4224 domain-containing protein [Chitinibacter sp. GC72]